MKGTTRRRATRRSGLLYGAAVALVLAAVAGFLLASGGGGSRPRPQAHSTPGRIDVSPGPSGTRVVGPVATAHVDLGSLAPADTTFGLLLPVTVPNAWQVVTGLGDTRMRLAAIHLPATVRVVGYLSSANLGHAADSGWPGTDVVILVTGSSADAAALSRRLYQVPDRKFVTAVSGSAVLVTQQWQDPQSLLRGPRLTSVAAYRTALAYLPDTGSGVLWTDAHAWLTQLASQQRDTTARTAFDATVAAAMPPGQSTWIGAASTDAYTYTGTWVGRMGTGEIPSNRSSGAACPPTKQICSRITTASPDQAARNIVASMVQVSGGTGHRMLGLDLGAIENFLGVGGMPVIDGLSLNHAADGSFALKLMHA